MIDHFGGLVRFESCALPLELINLLLLRADNSVLFKNRQLLFVAQVGQGSLDLLIHQFLLLEQFFFVFLFCDVANNFQLLLALTQVILLSGLFARQPFIFSFQKSDAVHVYLYFIFIKLLHFFQALNDALVAVRRHRQVLRRVLAGRHSLRCLLTGITIPGQLGVHALLDLEPQCQVALYPAADGVLAASLRNKWVVQSVKYTVAAIAVRRVPEARELAWQRTLSRPELLLAVLLVNFMGGWPLPGRGRMMVNIAGELILLKALLWATDDFLTLRLR